MSRSSRVSCSVTAAAYSDGLRRSARFLYGIALRTRSRFTGTPNTNPNWCGTTKMPIHAGDGRPHAPGRQARRREKMTDTNGEQGLGAIEYREPDDASRAWVESLRGEGDDE